MTRIPPFEVGEPLRVAKINAIVEAVNRLGSIRGDGRIRVQQTADGVTLTLVGDGDAWVPARITAAPAPGVAIAASAAQYTAAAIGAPDVRVEARVPEYRNVPIQAGQSPAPGIYPARVGDDCHLVVGPDPSDPETIRVRLAVWSEGVVWCPPAGS